MVGSGQSQKLLGMALLLGLALAALGVHLVVLQVVRHEEFRSIAERNTRRFFLREPRRGDILDANGHPLATSVPVKKVLADPSLMGPHAAEVARVLGPLLAYAPTELAELLRPTILRTNAAGQPVTNQYVNLRRKVSVEQWGQITAAMTNLSFGLDERKLPRTQRAFYRNLRQSSIYAVDAYHRAYPSQNLAAHVVGYVLEEEKPFNDLRLTELTGRDGIERWLDSKLTGVRGWRFTQADNRGRREILPRRAQDVEARPGLSAVLTLDMVVQGIVEAELAEVMKKHSPISAQAVVVRPRTGEILALAVLPNYDPNQPGQSRNLAALRNRVISDMVEPGSTFKIVVVSAALHEGLVSLNDTFDCERGRWVYMGRPLRDHDSGYGLLSVENIITKSSNIGTAKIAIYKLGEQRLHNYVAAFGFGSRTGIPLPAEINGWLTPVKNWDRLTVSRIPMGQSIGVTHLQMTLAMAAVANDGWLMRPMLIRRLVDHTGQVFAEYEPQPVRQVVSERAAGQMVAALKTVVSKEGTGAKAMLDHYTVAGKTGTAQKVIDRQYAPGRYIASFIGFFPTDQPELCISVMLDEPQGGYYGGQTAAPAFKKIAEQIAGYLKVRPDREERGSETIASAERLNTAATRHP